MKIKAVIIGFAHMHVNEVALYITEQPDFELVGAADVNAGEEKIADLRYTAGWNLKNVRENYCDNIYNDYRKMLDELKESRGYSDEKIDNIFASQLSEAEYRSACQKCIDKVSKGGKEQ